MGATDPGSAREEAERLVATLLATARLATAGSGAGQWGPLGGIVTSVLGHSAAPGGSTAPGGGGLSTGAPECCVCPVCRAIAAMRDPSPEFAERLATGAGDLAAGVASLLRAFAPPEQPRGPGGGPTHPAPGGGGSSDDDHVWREATRSGHDSPSAPERDVWSAATRAEEPVEPTAAPPVDDAGPVAPAQVRPAADRRAVPASRAPDGADGDASGDGA
ncbi:hypothetical protein [Micromonospora endolithica]|uniref:Uncharacterized protein n=1 Tax=Micromonospora endolithica TaxID=230091 RepID=A0A3A9ZRE9_9ACTN|nr:hypothetical protein [Micromonospora endolithica]RKN50842.1 hypothetical protein D7223_03585 [Micromonospora endolithica]TWJ20393.1 hypothetical protein JD76_00491 [Micromonospora endolithica]